MPKTNKYTVFSQSPQIDIIKKAADIILNGGIVAFPTETVYGLGASALNETAVQKIYDAKNRPPLKALICHLSSPNEAEKIAYLTPEAELLLKTFSPGPLTVVLKKKPIVPDIVSAGMDTVALRIPDNEVARTFISLCGVPIAAPSANLSGKPSPHTADDVLEQLDGRIDAVIDGGTTSVGIESTIVSLVGAPRILRIGAVSPKEVAFALKTDENSLLSDSDKKETEVVGLCGRSGAGKTTASTYLKEHGFYCIDSDEISHEIMASRSDCLVELCKFFGNDILYPDGTLNRHKLSEKAFSSDENAELLNRISHFYIIERIKSKIAEAKAKKRRYIIIDAPLLFESGLDKICKFTIAITTDDEICRKRIIERDGIDRFAAEKRLNHQKSNDFLKNNCTFYIDNTGTNDELYAKLMECFCDKKEK